MMSLIRTNISTLWGLLPLFCLLVATSFLPTIDIALSALFYDPSYYTISNKGFWLADNWLAKGIHDFCLVATRALAAVLIAAIIARILYRFGMLNLNDWFRRYMNIKTAVFFLAVLAIGPGLVTNTLLKDHWGRARPNQIELFGGKAFYTPPLAPTDQCERNCSFVAGDPSFGFALHAPFYLVAARRRRAVFWGGFLGGGLLFGIDRLVMGGHFASDILWAGLLMLITTAAVHASLYGWRTTRDAWRNL